MRANRFLSLLFLLQARGRMTADEIAAELGVSTRTVYRDLTALSEAGVPVLTERGAGGGVQLHPRYQSGLTGLSAREAEALVALSMPTLASQLGLERSLSAARRKLVAATPSSRRHAQYRDRIHLDPTSWFRQSQEVPALRPLVDAVWAERAIEIGYRSYGSEPRSHALNPLGLVIKDGTWYLVADTRDGVRVFRVSRVESVSVLRENFRPPADFDLVAFWSRWASAFESSRPRVTVTVRIRKSALGGLARVAEEWNEEVVATQRGDGREWLRLDVPFERLEYAQSSLLSLGADVEVIEPRLLRKSMATTARAMARSYASARARRRGM